MSTVTQRIPNLLSGISQQPDNRKFPGQLRDSVNAFPDYTLGLLKRPGGQFTSKLYGATPEGKWFSILRDQQEKYVAQYDDNTFRVWSLIDSTLGEAGSPRAVDMGTNTGVPGTCNLTNLKADLTAYNDAVEDTAAKLALLHAAQADYAEILAGQDETQEALFEVSYTYPSGEVDQALKSGILKNASGVYTVKNNDTVVSVSTTLPANYALGSEYTDEYPLLAAEGYRVYQAILTVAAANTAAELTAAETAMNTAQTNYNNAVTAEATAKTNYDAEVTNCNITATPSNGYLYGATADDIELLTLNDYTFVLNKAKTVALKTATSAAQPHQAFVTIKVVGTGHYRIYLDGTERATHNAGSGGDVDGILTDLASDIDGNTFGGTTFSATVVGPGIYISATAAFTIRVVGGPSDTAMTVFQDTAPTVADLPLQCKDGYVVKIVNSTDIDVDDMYVKFVADGTATYGTGVWEETIAPGIKYEFDELTMPHQLVRNADGSFTFGPINWEDRLVGDETTNPDPSFVGQKINNLFFYRNRLGFLSNEAVVMSRAGDYFNFWVTTALTVTDDDPIDVTASSVRPVNYRFVLPTSVGLVLFSDTEQFILTTDADILSPRTAKINQMSSYDCDPDVAAVGMGTNVGFISKTPLYSRFYEIARISKDNPPEMFEQTKVVPELIPATVDSMIASPAMSVVSMATTGSSTVYQYRFLDLQGGQRLSSWYKWDLTGTFLDQFFDSNEYYAVVKNGTDVYVQSYDLTQASEEGFLTLPTGEKTDVCLDLWNVNPYRTYDSSADTTRIFLPYDEVTDGTLAVIILGGYIGDDEGTGSQSVGRVLYPTVEGTAGAYYVDVDEDFRGRDLIIGYNYTMTVELPEFYVISSEGSTASSDFTSDLIIHRVKVSTGLSGPVKYQVTITGRPEWSNTIEAVAPYDYTLNNVNMAADAIHTVPIYQRNENLNFKIIGDTPFPVSLRSLNWEGKYNPRFYRRS
jgi:hypothetical protein